jgi:hypothetical protein
MYEPPTIEPLDKSLGLYLLRDGRGNLLGAGSPDVLGLLLTASKRCAQPVSRGSALSLTRTQPIQAT